MLAVPGLPPLGTKVICTASFNWWRLALVSRLTPARVKDRFSLTVPAPSGTELAPRMSLPEALIAPWTRNAHLD